MMRSNREYRAEARTKLLGNYGTVIGAYILYSLILNLLTTPLSLVTGLDSFFPIPGIGIVVSLPLSLLLSFVSVLFAAGVDKISYDISYDRKGDVSDIFYCFKHEPFTVVFCYLWILLRMLPGIIIFVIGMIVFAALTVSGMSGGSFAAAVAVISVASLIYLVWIFVVKLGVSMTFFLYYENPGMRARDIVDTSVRMMKGNKGRLFSLYLSYIGYYILAFLSCGLALLWLNPNITVSTALFYDDLKKEGNGSYVNDEPVKDTASGVYYHQEYWN